MITALINDNNTNALPISLAFLDNGLRSVPMRSTTVSMAVFTNSANKINNNEQIISAVDNTPTGKNIATMVPMTKINMS